MALLTLVEQNLIKALSPNWTAKAKITGGVNNFVQLQTEVENNELRDLLGRALLLDIQTNPGTASNVILLEGTTFKDCDDNDIKFEGIKFQLAYMNYSKYVRISPNNDTFTGFVKQNRNETEYIDEGAVKREQQDAREIALKDFEIMKLYLNDNTVTYPLWNCGKTKKIYTPKLTTLRKTYN
jgi:hypothetical protein